MRILIFGATGVVGRRVVPALIEQGHQVTAHGRTTARRATLRFSLFYGPDSPQTAGLISAVRRDPALMPGPGSAYTSSVSHDDAAAAVLAAVELPAGIYNVSDDLPLTRREYVDSLAEALRVNPPRLLPEWTKTLMGSLGETLGRSLRISNRKLRETSAWSPRFPSARDAWPAVIGP